MTQHPDDMAVDRFFAAMKAKLAKKRDDGRGGWEDKEQCSGEYLSRLLREHVEKGDPIDVANFAMMLHQRGERISPKPQFLTVTVSADTKACKEIIQTSREEIDLLAGRIPGYYQATEQGWANSETGFQVTGLPIELDGISDALEYGKGFWRTCTGCHESNEGHPTGPYSSIMRCHLGCGCFECGGIGAIWDTTDYAAMGEYIAANAPENQEEPVAWLRHGEKVPVQNVPFGAIWISDKDDPRAFPVYAAPPPQGRSRLIDINAVIALVRDSGEDAMPDSEYRRACDDLVEALSDFAPAPEQHLVGEIVPPHCSGSALAFEPGVLHVNKDGSGYIAINEDDFVLEDDRCEGPDGPEGSVHWIARMDASEIIALRDFLNGNTTADRLADKIEDLISEFGDDPKAALECVSEHLQLRRHARAVSREVIDHG